jgi:hypothetical protein
MHQVVSCCQLCHFKLLKMKLLLVLAVASVAWALFEDQAGLFDWYATLYSEKKRHVILLCHHRRTELVGPAGFLEQLADGTVITASRLGSVAALSSTDGSIGKTQCHPCSWQPSPTVGA